MKKANDCLIIVTGLLRNWTQSELELEKISEWADLVFVTSLPLPVGVLESDIPGRLLLVDSYPLEVERQRGLSLLDGGEVFFQWHKLDFALRTLKSEGELNKYTHVLRLRTDTNFSWLSREELLAIRPGELLARSDWMFAARSVDFLIFENFLTYALDTCYKAANCRDLDWTILRSWAPLSIGVHRMLIAEDAFRDFWGLRALRTLFKITTGPGHGILRTNNISQRIALKYLSSISQVLNGYPVSEGRQLGTQDKMGDLGKKAFPSERCFAHFCAEKALRVGAFSSRVRIIRH